MKEIGILGTGRMAVRLADMFAKAGVSVILGSRTPERAIKIAKELAHSNIIGGSYEDAIKPQWILPALFIRDGLLEILNSKKESLKDKVLLDITNPFNDTYSDFTLAWDTSGSEEVQKTLSGIKIIGAFKNVWYEVFDKPMFEEGVSDVYMISDHQELKDELAQTLKETPFRYIDAGALKNARVIERMTLLATELSIKYEYFPRANWKFLGEKIVMGENDIYKDIIAR